MRTIRTDQGGFGGLFLAGSAFVFLCSVPGLLAAGVVVPAIDSILLSCAAGGVIFTVLFAAGHRLLRWSGTGHRGWYTALGSLALMLAYATRVEAGGLSAVFIHGLFAYFFFLPAIVGASLGYLYAWRAGWERDDPAQIETALVGHTQDTAVTRPALIEADTAAYFSGPLRVRTSFSLMILSSLIGGGVLFLCRAVLVLKGEVEMLADPTVQDILQHAADVSLFIGFEMIALSLLGILPITLCLIAGHFSARGLKTKAVWAYFGIGLVAPFVIALFSIGLLSSVAETIALPTAVSMALYRLFAGLEPEPVAEDIIVSDARSLVAADHPRRQFGRVIRPSRSE